MRILLTGATGFLGSHLVKALLARNHSVLAYRRHRSDLWRLQDEQARVQWFALPDDIETPFLTAGPIDAIIHGATCYGRKGETVRDQVETNILLPIDLLNLAQTHGIPLFLDTGTSHPAEITSYGLAKFQARQWMERLASSTRVIHLALEMIYGPLDDDTKMTTQVLRACLRNDPSIDLTSGEQLRDFIHVDDAVEAYLAILEHHETFTQPFQIVPIGSGTALPVRDYVEMVHRLTRSQTVLHFGARPQRSHEPHLLRADLSRLQQIGWNPAFDLPTGLADMIHKETTL
jgi:nucleoside-diphosphate-sugar epimerase